MLTAENGRVGMKVVAKTALTAAQGFSIPVGTVGEVKVMLKTAQWLYCSHQGREYNGFVSVLWNDQVGYPAIHSDLTDIIIQCSKI